MSIRTVTYEYLRAIRTALLYTGQAAQLHDTQGQSRSGNREVLVSVHTDPWLMHAWLLFRSKGKKLSPITPLHAGTQAVQLGFSL